MTDMTTSLLLLVVAAFAVAGFVKGATGMGLPAGGVAAVAMALLASQISPVVAAGLLVIPSLVTNVWQLLTGPDVRVLLRRLWPMMIVMAVVTYATSGLIAGDNTAGASRGIIRRRRPRRWVSRWSSMPPILYARGRSIFPSGSSGFCRR
ncbi:conserved hypothetical protein [Ketogulonicigenium vulgare Y25]|uniref:hypothetical protein n=1 Tax=Ketogulonicigenium vulgare TaxID=92945 RepID=UPI0001E66CFA|nr:hypothetical protein [Ketogulonicigenium vulgare]ADO41827.1 conserved hypothetical protein [Ketogulonicigenium vulgare Y25]